MTDLSWTFDGFEAHIRVEELLGHETIQISTEYVGRLLRAARVFEKLGSIASGMGAAIEPSFVNGHWTLTLNQQQTVQALGVGETLVDAAFELLESLEPTIPNVVKAEHELQLTIDKRRKKLK